MFNPPPTSSAPNSAHREDRDDPSRLPSQLDNLIEATYGDQEDVRIAFLDSVRHREALVQALVAASNAVPTTNSHDKDLSYKPSGKTIGLSTIENYKAEKRETLRVIEMLTHEIDRIENEIEKENTRNDDLQKSLQKATVASHSEKLVTSLATSGIDLRFLQTGPLWETLFQRRRLFKSGDVELSEENQSMECIVSIGELPGAEKIRLPYTVAHFSEKHRQDPRIQRRFSLIVDDLWNHLEASRKI